MPRIDDLAARLPDHVQQNYLALHAEGTSWVEIARRAMAAGDRVLAEWAGLRAEAEAPEPGPVKAAAKRAAAAEGGADVTPDAAAAPVKRTAKASDPATPNA